MRPWTVHVGHFKSVCAWRVMCKAEVTVYAYSAHCRLLSETVRRVSLHRITPARIALWFVMISLISRTALQFVSGQSKSTATPVAAITSGAFSAGTRPDFSQCSMCCLMTDPPTACASLVGLLSNFSKASSMPFFCSIVTPVAKLFAV